MGAGLSECTAGRVLAAPRIPDLGAPGSLSLNGTRSPEESGTAISTVSAGFRSGAALRRRVVIGDGRVVVHEELRLERAKAVIQGSQLVEQVQLPFVLVAIVERHLLRDEPMPSPLLMLISSEVQGGRLTSPMTTLPIGVAVLPWSTEAYTSMMTI